MWLKQIEGNQTHISHFHSFVSAYETNKETVDFLAIALSEALQCAQEMKEPQIVDQDNLTHIFVVHPFGTISLYREVGHYEVIREEEKNDR